MEFTDEKGPCKLKITEARRSVNLPRISSISQEDDYDGGGDPQPVSARTSCASAASFRLWPTSPETVQWTRTPTNAAQSPAPLLYHCLASLHRSEGSIFSVYVTKDFIFTGSSSCRIHVWKLLDCSEVGYIKASSGDIRAISGWGRFLFTSHGDGRIRAWDVPSAENFRSKKIATLPGRSFFKFPKKSSHQRKNPISCLAYSNMERLLFTGSWDRTVKVWQVSERRCVDSFIAHDGPVNAIVINQEDGCVFTCSSDGTVKIWRRVCGESSHILTMKLKFQPSPVNALALSMSSQGNCFLYSGSSDGLINFWEKERISGRYNHLGFLQGHHFAVLCLVTIEDLILSGSEDATIRIWKREDGNSLHSCVAVVDGHHGPVKCLAAAMEGDEMGGDLVVYSGSLDQTLKVWRVKVVHDQLYSEDKVLMKLDRSEGNDHQYLEYCRMSPVLSPSWVEKKISGGEF
ncbi:protein JINGUBANG-like [Henckelia pumila]|uniref:protein JINGUBANG-like n=1 Tax=Henckelia pumila TaxID=405737 RepID=UPI003C6DEE54